MQKLHKVWFSDLCFIFDLHKRSNWKSQSNPKLFADGNSFFAIINEPKATAKQVFEDFGKIKEWTFQWKMSFSSDPSTQAQVIFTRKSKNVVPPPIFFNKKPIQQVPSQKNGSFDVRWKHIKAITSKVSIGLLQKFNNHFPRSSLTTIYKLFVRPCLNYDDVIFAKAYNNSFQQRLESLQYGL